MNRVKAMATLADTDRQAQIAASKEHDARRPTAWPWPWTSSSAWMPSCERPPRPQHQAAFADIITPFGAELAKAYG
jgi:hypothetical protein